MPDYSWTCRACQEDNPPFTEVCRNCYVPFGQGTSIRRCSCGEPLDSGQLNCPQCGRKNSLLKNALEPEYEVAGYWNRGVYIPNKIPRRTVIAQVVLSTILLLQVVFGLLYDDIAISSRTLSVVHFHGSAVWFMSGCFLFLIVSMMAVVADHFDTRPNESLYKQISLYSTDIAVVLLAIAIAISS